MQLEQLVAQRTHELEVQNHSLEVMAHHVEDMAEERFVSLHTLLMNFVHQLL